MTNKQLNKIARQISNLGASDQLNIIRASDEELPKVLQRLGIELPSSSWIMVVIKILLFGLGLVLAGMGSVSAANIIVYGC